MIKHLVLSGTHSTGKTTLINGFRDLNPDGYPFDFVKSVTRDLKEKGFPINSNEASNYNLTQIICGNRDFENILLQDRPCMFDRTLLDTLVYSDYLYSQGKLDQWIVAMQVKLFEQVKDRFKHYFLFMPDFELVSDGVREEDKAFRQVIHNNFLKWMDHFKIDYIRIQGTHEQRLDTLMQVVDNLVKTKQLYHE